MSKASKKSGGLLPIVGVVVLIALAGFIGGRMYGSKHGAIQEKAPVDPYTAVVESDFAADDEDAPEPEWDEDSPSNYADETSLE